MKLNNNIRQTFRVAKIELSSMFYSPVAWLVLIIFALLIGYDYANVFDSQLRAKSLGSGLWNVSSAIYNSWMTGILKPILRNLYLYIPLIKMCIRDRCTSRCPVLNCMVRSCRLVCWMPWDGYGVCKERRCV